MQLKLPGVTGRLRADGRQLMAAGRTFPVEIFRRRGARRYVVRVTPEAIVRITVPYGASIAGGLAFAERQGEWIAREWTRQCARVAPWADGSECWFRGERVPVAVSAGRIRFAGEDAGAAGRDVDIRAAVEARLRALAEAELPARCRELASGTGRTVARVSVRNQRSRWGACSPGGSITLNWRLVQVPAAVRDYVILHELAHLTVLNHSRRFWREVARLCPAWQDAERWLKQHEREIF